MSRSTSDKVVVFEASGAFAHFKRFYTTSSPTSYALPPRTALQGMIGAILGYAREEYLQRLETLQVAVSLRTPVKRIRFGTNWINTKSSYKDRPESRWQLTVGSKDKPQAPRLPVRIEFLKDVRYRIYINHPDAALLDTLESMLQNNEAVYTPCLGLSECIAELSYLHTRRISGETIGGEAREHVSAVPSEIMASNSFSLSDNRESQIFKERLPSVMHPDRSVSVYREVIFEATGKPLHLRTRGASVLETGETIAYL